MYSCAGYPAQHKTTQHYENRKDGIKMTITLNIDEYETLIKTIGIEYLEITQHIDCDSALSNFLNWLYTKDIIRMVEDNPSIMAFYADDTEYITTDISGYRYAVKAVIYNYLKHICAYGVSAYEVINLMDFVNNYPMTYDEKKDLLLLN